MHNPLDLSGKLIMVTGASSGIGRATALVLSQMGARLILSGRRGEALEETASACENPANHLCSVFDLANLDEIPKWVAQTVQVAGAPLDGAVHCAGVIKHLPLRVASASNIASIMIPNLHATLMMLRAVSARNVVNQAGASIVLVSSAAALIASPGLATYSASKAALESVARCAAKELAAKRIRVNCIAPGYVKTPMLDQAADAMNTLREIEDKQFLGLTEPGDIGMMAAYLLSSAARSITGAQFVMDGGYTL
jgi:NAD(P)-dependent dehydrogenase (short-subunit alcohol dehydrogenase family)